MEPELPEYFEIHLVDVESSDGIVGSTPTSGASIDPLYSTQNISLPESDYPYGLLEFSVMEKPPTSGDPRIPPATEIPQVRFRLSIKDML
jgi:G-protein coupled receptor 98